MDNIEDINSYVRSMSTTLYDKCWWIDKIPQNEVKTVVDYGCAQGDLSVFINRIFPDMFQYIGIDNSNTMIALANHNHKLHFSEITSHFFTDFSQIHGYCDPETSILVLNSVMHEILSYLSECDRKILLKELFGYGFRYIAIRDMHTPTDIPNCPQRFFDSVIDSMYGEKWEDFNNHCDASKEERLTEFLLKYRYSANWEREKREVYLWPWMELLNDEGLLSNYDIQFENEFYVPYIKEKIKKDFGIDWVCNTHRKVLLGLKD